MNRQQQGVYPLRVCMCLCVVEIAGLELTTECTEHLCCVTDSVRGRARMFMCTE